MSFYYFCINTVKVGLFPLFRVRAKGRENVPTEGPAILAVNHSSNFDPMVTGITCPRQLSFMAKSELFENKIFGGLISRLGAFPVHRGKGDISAFKTAIKIFKSNGVMLIFPEGSRVKPGKTSKAKTGVVVMAQKCKVPVIPVHISGEYKWMHKITVSYGKPISFEEYYDKKLTGEETQMLADKVLDTIYSL